MANKGTSSSYRPDDPQKCTITSTGNLFQAKVYVNCRIPRDCNESATAQKHPRLANSRLSAQRTAITCNSRRERETDTPLHRVALGILASTRIQKDFNNSEEQTVDKTVCREQRAKSVQELEGKDRIGHDNSAPLTYQGVRSADESARRIKRENLHVGPI